MIAVGWAVAEACVVHLKFRRSAHSFSLADIPFVFGLLFASGADFLAGALIGTAIAYACRRLPLIKLAFNLAQLALAVCVAVVIVRALAIPADALEPATWPGMYLATLATGALTIACIAGAIALTEGGMNPRTLRQDVRHGRRGHGDELQHRDRGRDRRRHRPPRGSRPARARPERLRGSTAPRPRRFSCSRSARCSTASAPSSTRLSAPTRGRPRSGSTRSSTHS